MIKQKQKQKLKETRDRKKNQHEKPTTNITVNSQRLNAFPLKSKTSMSALIASIQLMIILQTSYVRREPDSLLA